MGVACGAAHPPRGRAPVNTIRSVLDGLDPRVRFLVTSAVSFALIFVVVLAPVPGIGPGGVGWCG